jgi:mono/diheme cytochrome c family protein
MERPAPVDFWREARMLLWASRNENQTKEEVMKKVLSGIAVVAMLCLAGSVSRAQDAVNGEKTFKAKCAACHGPDAAGKSAMKSPSIKGKTADEIQKEISTSPKHASLKSLTADQVKDLAAYLGTLK